MAEELIKKLGLLPYPGIPCKNFYYKEIFRSNLMVKPLADDREKRTAFTTIYFLATHGDYAKWRKLKSDETFFHHRGDPFRIAVIKPEGDSEVVLVGDKLKNDEASYQYSFRAGSWFNFCLKEGDSGYGLAGCACAPGFEYADIETADLAKLIEQFPQHKDLINEFTNK